MTSYYKMYKITEKLTMETNKELQLIAVKKDNENLTKQLYETLKRLKKLKEIIIKLENIVKMYQTNIIK